MLRSALRLAYQFPEFPGRAYRWERGLSKTFFSSRLLPKFNKYHMQCAYVWLKTKT